MSVTTIKKFVGQMAALALGTAITHKVLCAYGASKWISRHICGGETKETRTSTAVTCLVSQAVFILLAGGTTLAMGKSAPIPKVLPFSLQLSSALLALGIAWQFACANQVSDPEFQEILEALGLDPKKMQNAQLSENKKTLLRKIQPFIKHEASSETSIQAFVEDRSLGLLSYSEGEKFYATCLILGIPKLNFILLCLSKAAASKEDEGISLDDIKIYDLLLRVYQLVSLCKDNHPIEQQGAELKDEHMQAVCCAYQILELCDFYD